MDRKAQTSIEYLLILIVALVVVLLVFIWMQGTTVDYRDRGAEVKNDALCELTPCTDNSECDGVGPCEATSKCGFDRTCDPILTDDVRCAAQTCGGTVVCPNNGYCGPSATCNTGTHQCIP